MSVSGISSSSFFNNAMPSIQNGGAQRAKEFQQLGQDLQSGNLSAAQSDFAALEQSSSQSSSTSSAQSNNPLAQDFTQLGKDLQAGNTSAAQQDFAKIQQDFQSQSTQAHPHHHHHGGGGESESSEITQSLDQLGQALQSGNISTAQQAYSSLEQEFQQFSQSNGSLLANAATSLSTGDGVSVNA